MTKVILSPTEPLTPLAQNQCNNLDFGQGPLQHLIESFEKRDLNFFGRAVQKLDQFQSFLADITKLVAAILLASSLVGIPLLILVSRELSAQRIKNKDERDIIFKLNIQNHKINKRAEIIDQLDLANFTTIHLLNLKGRVSALVPSDLSHSIMKGTDKKGEAFISLKIKRIGDIGAAPLNQEFVITLVEKGPSFWDSCSIVRVPELIDLNLNFPHELDIFRLIIGGYHLDFKLS